jgi:hypothetical protein
MATLKERIAGLIKTSPGLTDREVTDRLLGASVGQQAVNQAARALEGAGSVVRRPRPDGRIGNYPDNPNSEPGLNERVAAQESTILWDGPSEDDVKRDVERWLRADGWHVDVKWGRDRGIDIDATKEGARWIIEAKGCGSRDQMRVNYFVSLLGELLQRMSDSKARYSIALPDMRQYRSLWQRLPRLAKSRTGVTQLFPETGRCGKAYSSGTASARILRSRCLAGPGGGVHLRPYLRPRLLRTLPTIRLHGIWRHSSRQPEPRWPPALTI